MNREQILNHFTKNIKDYQQYAKNIGGTDDADDLFQECSMMLLEYSEERLISYWNEREGLKPFFLRMLQLQYKSKTSYFHAKYRKQEQFINDSSADIRYHEQTAEIEGFEVNINEVVAASNSVSNNTFENMVWNLYIETGSLRKTLAAIPEEYADLFDLKLVHRMVQKFQREIKRRMNLVD
jgi:DNA-directed RNA polymerase specialized sigma24 family protein